MPTITNYTEDVRITNQQKGLQTTALLLDANGVPESYNSTPNTARVYDDTIISTGFKPSIARYSIEEESSGLMQDFGGEEIDDVDFNGTGSWSSNAAITIGGGVASFVNTPYGNALANSQLDIEIGATYLINIVISSYTSGKIVIELVGTSNSVEVPKGVGTYQLEVQSNTASVIYVTAREADTTLDITSLSMKQLTTKTQRTEKRLLTHTDAKLGVQEVANEDFDDDSAWSVTAAAVDISGGVANFNGTVGNLTQTLDGVIENDEYLLSITTSGTYAGNGLTLRFGNLANIIANIDADGTHTAIVPATGTDGIRLRVTSANDFIGTVDNVSVRSTKEENKYYIGTDGGAMVEQTVVPPLPDPNTTINLGNTCVIGYPDTIDTRLADFNVHSEVITP